MIRKYPGKPNFGGEIWSTVRLGSGSGCRDHPYARKSGLGTLPILELSVNGDFNLAA